MRRSPLEIYIEIIGVLAQYGPLKPTHIMYKANLNCNALKNNLRFLVKLAMVEERIIGEDRIVFAVTQRGIKVLRYFKELQQTSPSVEKAQKIRCI
jgi:predicted transcriptional regulator